MFQNINHWFKNLHISFCLFSTIANNTKITPVHTVAVVSNNFQESIDCDKNIIKSTIFEEHIQETWMCKLINNKKLINLVKIKQWIIKIMNYKLVWFGFLIYSLRLKSINNKWAFND